MSVLANVNNMYNSNKKGVKKNASIKRFLNKVGNNRVLDLYLKYLGVTLLTTNTLIPLAFILGAKTFNNVVKDMMAKDQKGGSFFDNKLPILDDAAVGTYLKITGLTAIPLSPYTLVPLGLLMVLYDKMNMKGGSCSNVSNNSIFYNTKNKKLEFNKQSLSGGSGWKASQYSMGPYNTNLTTPEIYGQFNKTLPYTSNYDFKLAGYYDNVPNTLTHNPIDTTNSPFPLAADMYGGKKKRRSRRTKKKLTKSKRRRLAKKGKKRTNKRKTKTNNRRKNRN